MLYNYLCQQLDRQKKNENENPSVGMILCASKDDEDMSCVRRGIFLAQSIMDNMSYEYKEHVSF